MTSGVGGVLRAGTCAGCGACAAISTGIEIGVSESGFLRPLVQRTPTAAEDEQFDRVCPSVRLDAPLTHASAEATDEVLWGPVVRSRTAWSTDPALRHAGASGGALSALLVHLLEHDVVDAIVHVAADEATPWANRVVVSRSAGEVLAAAGSRYAPSAPLAELDSLLACADRFAFVGKPCDVAALRKLAAVDPRYADRFTMVVSFFCAGVPSLAGAEEVLDRLGVARDDVRAFRYRGMGWPGRAVATLADGTSHGMTYADSWGGVLSRHVQVRCTICPDGVGAFADVVCADAWETDDAGYPRFAEAPGVSAVLTRTDAGERLVRDAIAAGHLEVGPLGLDDLERMQPGQVSKATYGPARRIALRLCGRDVPTFRGFHQLRRVRRGGLVAGAKQLVGTVRRARSGRLRS